MEGLSAAANIIAVVQLAAKVGKVCVQYAREVKNAPKDIERVKEQVDAISKLLIHTQRLLDGPYRSKLSASTDLESSLSGCKDQLDYLLRKLEVDFTQHPNGKGRRRDKLLRPFKISSHDLKWPFTKTEADDIIRRLITAQELINRALQVDQINVVLSVEQKANLEKLPIANGAIFNSFEDEDEPECLPGTRTDLLRDLNTWIADPKETRIFWLCGMAGTGKSTISRTLARILSENGQLGASFFFKRGKANRGDASRFFSTLAMDLQSIIPQLGPYISETVEKDPNICQKSLSEQFQKLLFDPLKKIRRTDVPDPSKALVLVIDALDECEGDGIVQRIIEFFGQLAGVDLNMRIFATSRPEAPIKAGFEDLTRDHKDILLHNIQEPTIKDDISIFLQYEFGKIRKTRKLGSNWPGDGTIVTLTDMTVPLFISAATLCRFIGDKRFSVHQRLENVLKFRNASFASKLDQTYRPIFDQILADTDKSEEDELIRGFQEIVGTIILLESPLGLTSLSILLDMEEEQLHCRLDRFQSVINISDDPGTPIQIYHLSFRDYLLDRNKHTDWFRINSSQLHWSIGANCLRFLSKALKPDICNLIHPGTRIQDIDPTVRGQHITPEIAYSCQYWAYHLTHCMDESGLDEEKSQTLLKFLESHLLHWLETMIILGALDKALDAVNNLQSPNQGLSALLRDAIFFVNLHSGTISEAPLQLYSSALLFTPENSIIKRLFFRGLPAWIPRPQSWHGDWGYCVRDICPTEIEIQDELVISPDGNLLAFIDGRDTCEVRNAISGKVSQLISITELIRCDGQKMSILSVHFTEDSKYLVAIVNTGQVVLRDLLTGRTSLKIINLDINSNTGHDPEFSNSLQKQIKTSESSQSANYAAFSSDSMFLAFGYDNGQVKMWARSNFESDFQPSHLQGFDFDPILADRRPWDFLLMEFEPKTKTLAAVLYNWWPDGAPLSILEAVTIFILWDIKSGNIVNTYRYYNEKAPYACAFSVDCKYLAVALPESTVEIWDSTSHSTLQQLKESLDRPKNKVRSFKFSPDGKHLAIGYTEQRVRILDLMNEVYIERYKEERGGYWEMGPMVFSKNGYLLFCIRIDQLQAWCIDLAGLKASSHDGTLQSRQIKEPKVSRSIDRVSEVLKPIATLSPDRKYLAVSRSPGKLQLQDLVSGKSQILLTDEPSMGFEAATDFEFSSDSKWLAANRATGHLVLWETNNASGAPRTLEPSDVQGERRYEVAGGTPRSLCFSIDNNQLFYITGNVTVEAWNLATGSRSRIYMNERYRGFEIQALKPTPDGLHLLNLFGREFTTSRTLSFSEDGRLLAIAALRTVVILNIDISTAIGAIATEIVNNLSFSTGGPGTGHSLIINRGAESMTVDVSKSLQVSERSPGFLDLGWIVSNNSTILRLPSELHPTGSFVGVAGDVFVFLLENGDPFFLEITDMAIRNLLAEHTNVQGKRGI
ncbi:hypothetical protein AOL_s00076g375 [Orbilia oligospora ATCC 24927]|uniref:Uncharacterized protein n=1 Tax=Arthrobotrys oligospora (strain ATCC 24927 / CBS 115.81 / DSM 1491) TaxID=756982 RepID=G1X9Z2_ARTOA|nr:hypothetical protein AOL_s00076g375 [Orbilia oligospora ATCC 24927]EGX50024.1 hypothetical protein AOL_s00076g375 [Orbilia oligospora ATCC 24927]